MSLSIKPSDDFLVLGMIKGKNRLNNDLVFLITQYTRIGHKKNNIVHKGYKYSELQR